MSFFRAILEARKMKYISISLFIIISSNETGFCFTSCESCDSNLVRNSGFDEINALAYWCKGGPVSTMLPEFTVDHKECVSKPSSIHMTSRNPNVHGFINQKLAIEEGQTYISEVRFRCEGVLDIHKSILIRIKWLHGKEQTGFDYINNITQQGAYK